MPARIDAPLDVTGRATALRDVPLERFFSPRRLAVIGASETEDRPNTVQWRRLRTWVEARGGEAIPINPGRATVDGLACYQTVTDVPGQVDLAVILTSDVLGTVPDVLAKGVQFCISFAAGFAETGAEGREAQDRLRELVEASTTYFLGPNTNLNAFEEFSDLPPPALALISQSGHQGRPIFQAQELGVALSHWAPTGNEVDLEFADFAKWFADQPTTGAIVAYIEGFKDGRTLALAADHAARRRVPMVIVKVGRTEEGRSMAGSHTGKLTGSDTVTSAVFRQFGVTRVDGLDELLDCGTMLARAARPAPKPGGPGVVVYAISGGTGAHMADLIGAAGLRLPTLSAATQARLHEHIPAYLRVSNPVDNGGHPVGDERGRTLLDILVGDPDVDVLVCPITGAFPPMSDKLAQDLVDVAETTHKPICVIWGSPVGTESAYRDILLSSRRLVVFRTFPNAVRAIRAWADHHAFVERYRSPFAKPVLRALPARRTARSILGAGEQGASALSEWWSKELVRAYGIPTPDEHLATSAAEAVRAAEAIGYPVVLKACSPELTHKSDLGLVHVGAPTARAVRSVYADLVERGCAASPDGTIEGVIVSELVSGVTECVVGLGRDELFGPTVMVGLGGVFVEVLRDVSFRVPPFDRGEATRMVHELRGFPLLDGARGRPKADVDALVDVIVRVGRLGQDLSAEVAELDLNPIVVRARGRGAVALDALVVSRPQASRGPASTSG